MKEYFYSCDIFSQDLSVNKFQYGLVSATYGTPPIDTMNLIIAEMKQQHGADCQVKMIAFNSII